MDNRMSLVVKKILEAAILTKQDLLESTGLTKRQLDYTLQKINEYLIEQQQGFMSINVSHGGIDPKTRHFLEGSLRTHKRYVMNNRERQLFIFLLLLRGRDDFSLSYFTDVLEVSRSTVAKDLKDLDAGLQHQGLSLSYSRKNGYALKGDIQGIYAYLLRQVMEEVSVMNNRIFLDFFISEDTDLSSYGEIKEKLNTLAKAHQLKFAANRLSEYTYGIIFLTDYLKNGKVPPKSGRALNLAVDIPEAGFVRDLCRLFGFPGVCFTFLCGWVLSVTEIKKEALEIDEAFDLAIVDDLLLRLEFLSGISIQDKTTARQQVYQHFRAAHYRMLLDIPIINPLLDRIKDQYEELFVLVREAVKQYEMTYDVRMPEEEIAYLAIHFAPLTEKYRSEKVQIKAAVTCPNGIGSSVILHAQLQQIFPEFDFLPPLTNLDLKRVFSKVDIVFSTTGHHDFLQPGKALFVVNPLMTPLEKERLKNQVALIVGRQQQQPFPQIPEILGVISKHVDEKTLHLIENDLGSLFPAMTEMNQNLLPIKTPLSEVIDPFFIQLGMKAKDAGEAIEIASAPLLQKDFINKDYINRMKVILKEGMGYMVIAKHVALPHAKPEDGALKVGIGITVLAEPVVFGNPQNDPVKYIFVLSTIDRESHLNALAILVQLLDLPDFYACLEAASSPSQVLDFIHCFENQ